jgi:hypothetical protein
MKTPFDKRLAEARRRWIAGRLLQVLGDAILVAGVAALLAILAERAFAIRVLTPLRAGVFLGILALLAAVRWYLSRPSTMQVALAVDERLALRERFSTTLALARSADPFAAAAREETHRRAAQVDVRRHFPVRLTWRWAHASGTWVAVALAILFMPTLDLLGQKAAAEKVARRQEALDQAKADAAKATAKVEALAKQLGDPALAAELAKLNLPDLAANPQEIRRQAIRALADVAGKLDQMKQGDQAQAAQTLREMMKQVHSPAKGFSRDLAQALARGKFGKAAELAKELQDKLARGDLKDADREALAKELDELAKQLEKLAAEKKQLEDALEGAGLDKKLAGLSEQELRDALEKAGLSKEMIEKLLQKAKACQAASKLCSGLGKALGRCAGSGKGLSAGDLAFLSDQLGGLDAKLADLVAMEAALSDLEGMMAMLGEGLGGVPGIGEFSPGLSDSFGMGSGGPGQGSAPVNTGGPEPTGTKASRTPGQNKGGPIIATWYTKEEQIKGEATRDAANVVQAAKDAAAEAVSENRIPSRYHGSVKTYFDSLGQEPAKE